MLKENMLVDCNDRGTEYLVAKVCGQLSQILNGELQPGQLNLFVPYQIESPKSASIAVQISMFE